MKKLMSFIIVTALISAGVGYAIYSDAERYEHQLFQNSLREAAVVCIPLEDTFLNEKKLPKLERKLTIEPFPDANIASSVELTITAEPTYVRLRFGEGNTQLAKQTILLEPSIQNQRVVWKCLGGSVLMRFRSKACRLGKLIDLSTLSNYSD